MAENGLPEREYINEGALVSYMGSYVRDAGEMNDVSDSAESDPETERLGDLLCGRFADLDIDPVDDVRAIRRRE